MGSMNLSLYQVQAIVILDNTGQRVFARYYTPPHQAIATSFPTASTQKTFESNLYEKTKKQNSDVILFDNRIVCYKSSVDLMIYVVAGPEENELMIYAVVMAIREAMEMLLRATVDKRAILENYDLLSLVVDETVDDGVVLETDAVTLSTRVSRAPLGGDTGLPLDFSERGLMNAYQMAKQKLRDQILQ